MLLNVRSPGSLQKAVTDFCFCLCFEIVDEDIVYLSRCHPVSFKEKRLLLLRIRTCPPPFQIKTSSVLYLAAWSWESNLHLMPGLYISCFPCLTVSSPKSQRVWIFKIEVSVNFLAHPSLTVLLTVVYGTKDFSFILLGSVTRVCELNSQEKIDRGENIYISFDINIFTCHGGLHRKSKIIKKQTEGIYTILTKNVKLWRWFKL